MSQILPFSQAITVSTSPAYSTNDNIGGKLTMTGLVGGTGQGLLQQVELVDQAAQNSAIDIYFFNADPSNTTFTDNGAMDIADADMAKIIGVVSIAAADYKAGADNSFAIVKGVNLLIPSLSRIVYGALVSRGTPTYVATTDLALKLFVEV